MTALTCYYHFCLQRYFFIYSLSVDDFRVHHLIVCRIFILKLILVIQDVGLQVRDPNKATEFKRGCIMRKCCIDPDGRRSKIYFWSVSCKKFNIFKIKRSLPAFKNHHAKYTVKLTYCYSSKCLLCLMPYRLYVSLSVLLCC